MITKINDRLKSCDMLKQNIMQNIDKILTNIDNSMNILLTKEEKFLKLNKKEMNDKERGEYATIQIEKENLRKCKNYLQSQQKACKERE